jgi:hypothetical protein
MRLINETDSEAELVRVNRDRDTTAAAAVVKSSYVVEHGRCTLGRRQRAVLREPQVIAGVTLEPETVLKKCGVDIIVAGATKAPAQGTRMMGVGAAVGDWSRQLLVFGDRVWQRRHWRWTASEPASFREMPLTWANSFGGIARSNGRPSPHPSNPHGKGYVIDLDERTEGEPLPNLEDPDSLLEQPGQVIEPVGFAPLPSSSAIRVNAALDDEKIAGVNHSIFNVAHPRHRVAELHGGELCELRGWAGMEAGLFELPADAFVLEVSIAGRVHEFRPRIDTVCVFPSIRELVIIQRATFTYEYIRNIPRVARLRKVQSTTPLCGGGLHAHDSE